MAYLYLLSHFKRFYEQYNRSNTQSELSSLLLIKRFSDCTPRLIIHIIKFHSKSLIRFLSNKTCRFIWFFLWRFLYCWWPQLYFFKNWNTNDECKYDYDHNCWCIHNLFRWCLFFLFYDWTLRLLLFQMLLFLLFL